MHQTDFNGGQNGYNDNGHYYSPRASQEEDVETLKSAGFLSKTPSEDRRLLRTLTVSPETDEIQRNTPTPPQPRPVETRKRHEAKPRYEAVMADYDGTPNGYGEPSVRKRGAKVVRVVTPTDSDTQDEWQTGKTVIETNSHMLRYEVACDVTFTVGETREEIRAHKYMLLSRSTVFHKSLIKHLGNMDIRINVPDIKPSTFRDVLTYIYTDEFDIHTDNVTAMLYASKKFSLRGLADMCFRFLESKLDFETVCKIMEQAHIYNEHLLYEKALKFILMNGSAVMKSQTFAELCVECVETVLKSDQLRALEEHVFEAAITWAKMECRRQNRQPRDENLREMLGKLLYLIRFPTMDVTYFTHRVSLREILSNEETLSIFQYFHGEEQQLPSRFIKNERLRFELKTPDKQEPVILTQPKTPMMKRVTRFRMTDSSWKQHGPPDAISFSCSHPIVLFGIQIYGVSRGSETYQVKAIVYDDMKEEVRRFESQVHTNSTRNMYDVFLARPIRVPPRRIFTVVVVMKGAPTVKGIDGETVQVGDGVTFDFCNSNKSSNGTDVTVGQIPALLFNKTE